MTEREQFEAWMRTGELDATPDLEFDGEFYEDFDTQRAWRGWQARAAIASSDQADGGKSEAVAWLYEHAEIAARYVTLRGPVDPKEIADAGWVVTPLSAAPQAGCAPREALTDERISEIIEEFDGGSWIDGEYRIDCTDMMRLARAIEQAAQEKA